MSERGEGVIKGSQYVPHEGAIPEAHRSEKSSNHNCIRGGVPGRRKEKIVTAWTLIHPERLSPGRGSGRARDEGREKATQRQGPLT